VLSPSGQAVFLVKPQFEVGKGRVGKGGVVRSKEDHADVLRGIIAFMEQDSGFFPAGLTFSPITGPMGNIEYLLHAVRFPVDKALSPEAAADEAHRFFAEGRTSNG
jgi:23S rRNA (cytidine1920-2'-O)/16S rRNA (cytidine1409-2'-O)-methyltransferase